MRDETTDAIVIGAGVAGLAAAAKLARGGRRVRLLEARSRAGGRILSERPPGWPRTVELGAEFVHTGNPALWRWIEKVGLKPERIDEQRWLCRRRRQEPMPDGWDRINGVMKRIGPAFRGSFADWLREHRDEIPAEDQLLATAFVKGFQGAPPDRMSAPTLFQAAQEDEEQCRLAEGYGALVNAMVAKLPARRVLLELDAPVTSIHWRKRRVDVRTARGEWSAPAGLITVPLGVLRAEPGEPGAIAFRPAIPQKLRWWHEVESGHAIRVVLRLRDDIWRRGPIPAPLRARTGHAFGFLQSEEAAFPVWWAEAPSPVLVGWTGGPVAAGMVEYSDERIFQHAVATLAKMLGVRRDAIRRTILDWRTHNWAADAYTRGAYSYSTAGREDAPAMLARPVRGTLFFAGEATADPLELGTVHGAIASGERAAREILASR